MLKQKPASKLINAWRAGVPALVAEEPAYASLKTSTLDYIAIDSPQDVLAALRQLRAEPDRYLAMAANGNRRGLSYAVEFTRERWLKFLLHEVMPDFERWLIARRNG